MPVGNVIDTTAAGDSFNAGYMAARLKNRPPAEAAHIGAVLAAEAERMREQMEDIIERPRQKALMESSGSWKCC